RAPSILFFTASSEAVSGFLSWLPAPIIVSRLFTSKVSRREVQAPQQACESLVRAQAVELRAYFEEKQVFRPRLVSLFQPDERLILVSESSVNESNMRFIHSSAVKPFWSRNRRFN